MHSVIRTPKCWVGSDSGAEARVLFIQTSQGFNSTNKVSFALLLTIEMLDR
jgi:hypothetical protein